MLNALSLKEAKVVIDALDAFEQHPFIGKTALENIKATAKAKIKHQSMEKHMSKLKQELQDVGINPIEFIVDALTFKSLDEFKK